MSQDEYGEGKAFCPGCEGGSFSDRFCSDECHADWHGTPESRAKLERWRSHPDRREEAT